MSGNLYPDLVKFLRDAGCEFVREAKGSHEIWKSPLTAKPFTVPKGVRKKHTANSILKQAGLPKAF